jgi:type I restriction enzyme M protein
MKALSENKECKERLMNITPPGQHWAQELLYGIDTERDLVLTAKTNMIMHGDGSGNIIEADALVDFKEIPQLVKKLGEGYLKDRSAESTLITKKEFPVFSFVLSNPPFSLPLGEIDKKALSENFVLSEHYGAKKKSKNSEVFFVERWYQLLREGGEIGVVLPESAFDTPEYLPLRIFLLTRFKIEAIVALPEHAFAPFALQRTNLLFATKRPSEETRALLSFWSNSKYPRFNPS